MKLRLLPARTGLAWVAEGMSVFRQQPLRLAALLALYLLVGGLLAVFPVVGAALSVAMAPFLMVVLMAGTGLVADGRRIPLEITWVLFRGKYAPQGLELLKLGGVCAAGLMLLLAASLAVDGGSFWRIYSGQEVPTPEILSDARVQTAFWLVTLPGLLASALLWFAPGLVYWLRLPMAQAIFYSVVACGRNLGAMAVYALTWGGIAVALVIAGTLLTYLLLIVGLPPSLAAIVYLVGMLMYSTAVLTSATFAFRDTFDALEELERQGRLPRQPQG